MIKSKGRILLNESDSEEEKTSSEEEELDPEDVRTNFFLKAIKKEGHGKIYAPMYGGKLDSEELLDLIEAL